MLMASTRRTPRPGTYHIACEHEGLAFPRRRLSPTQRIDDEPAHAARRRLAAEVARQSFRGFHGRLDALLDLIRRSGEPLVGMTLAQPLQHCGGRQYRAVGIGDILAGNRWSGAVRRLEEA